MIRMDCSCWLTTIGLFCIINDRTSLSIELNFFSSHETSVRNGISNMNFFMISSLNNFCGKIASLSWKESSGGDLLPLSISIEIA